MSASEIGFVVGLKAEATLLAPLRCRVAIGGGGFDGAILAAESLIAAGVRRIISFGLAGGLDPALPAGSLLVPALVCMESENFLCDAGLMQWLGDGDPRALCGGTRVLADQASKAALFASSGAASVDLESGAVALVARRARAEFAVLRAVCDPASRDLPPAALLALDQGGKIDIFKVARSVISAPAQIGGLLALARDARAARAALQHRVAAIAGSHHG